MTFCPNELIRESTDLIGRPEPTIDQLGEKLRFVTAVKIAPRKKKNYLIFAHRRKVQDFSALVNQTLRMIFCELNLRPEVQKNLTPPSMKPFTQSYSCCVSNDTRSMHRFLGGLWLIMVEVKSTTQWDVEVGLHYNWFICWWTCSSCAHWTSPIWCS